MVAWCADNENQGPRRWCAQIARNFVLEQACSTFNVLRATSAKLGLHAGNMKFKTQDKEWLSIRIIVYIILCVFVYTSCTIKYTYNNTKHL
jgi:hypothetical protein